ncbi:zinc finger protein Xfin-like isoform X2 [Cimex lectularius]|nr:zinc finger protein Xfin-like isoform X2 [Cimex lectularius]XP_014247773.1 zinc finger protein Xfin-like isoform X2 [Cimex lectularius]XP_014247774.1 zinc finger protein Xfin-like isoform X2 [Cimex lectularius]
MAAPSMVSRSGDNLVVRSVVSGDALFGTEDKQEEEFQLFDTSNSGEEDHGGELPQCKIKRNYTCGLCDYYTQNPRFYLYHQKHVHKEKIRIYECPNCLYASKHSQKLQRHMHMVHVMGAGKRKILKAKAKPKSQTKQTAAPAQSQQEPTPPTSHAVFGNDQEDDQEPIYADDGTPVYKCSVCDMTSKSQGLIARHERVVHLKRKFYHCGKCNYVTHLKARYTKHVKYHSMPMIKCDLCDFKTPYKWNLDRHNKNHLGDGLFKCSICNFAADIKQSLTVHEMNHHIPPVGHIVAAQRRRLKVGASDTMGLVTEEDQIEQGELELLKMEREGAFEQNPADFVQTQLDFPCEFYNYPGPENAKTVFLKEPDHMSSNEDLGSNKLIQIKKYNCRLCDFKGNLGEVQRHETGVHRIKSILDSPKKKSARPIPNLIPIQGQLKSPSEKKQLNEENLNNISHNSSLKDFASLIGDEFSTADSSLENSTNLSESDKKLPEVFKRKNASFFDKLKEKLMTSANESNLTCSYCGHEAKCLSEHMKHQRTHMQGDVDEQSENSRESRHHSPELSSTRCPHCRHRFKLSADLVTHLQACPEANNQAVKIKIEQEDEEEEEEEEENEHDENEQEDNQGTEDKKLQEPQAHPMENKVFVWNAMPDSIGNERKINDFKHEQDCYMPQPEVEKKKLPDKSYVGVELKPGYGTMTSGDEAGDPKDFNVTVMKKVFKCPHCTFWASTASRFHVHIVGHLNKRPFQCSLCYYSSNWRWDITKHIRLKTLRDPTHEKAKVLLTDETGRRNYSKYNKYLTTMHMASTSSVKPLRKILPKDHHNQEQVQYGLKRSSTEHRDLEHEQPKKKPHLENKKTMWKCKKCYFRDSDRTVVLAHVREHYRTQADGYTKDHHQNDDTTNSMGPQSDDEQNNIPCSDYMCETCPFVCDSWMELEAHAEKHFVNQEGSKFKCQFCKFFAQDKEELMEHLDFHGENENSSDAKNIIFSCTQCPYVATSRAQLSYHTKGHSKDCNYQHKCHKCSYSAPNNTILALHVRLHCKYSGENNEQSKQPDETEADISGVDTSKFQDIPMVWVSRPMGISKLFKCRYCPHINMRKNNIQDHEKMHNVRANSQTMSQIHPCSKCSYVCNNAGVLSSHIKVHMAHFGQVVGVVDPSRTDSEQIAEMKAKLAQNNTKESRKLHNQHQDEVENVEKEKDDRILHFCPICPARFLYAKEMTIHMGFHELKLPFKCQSCSYTARQKQHLLAHLKVHTDEYQGRTNVLVEKYEVAEDHPRPKAAIILNESDKSESIWVVVRPEEEEKISEPKPKNYACTKCPAEFFKSVALNYHMTLHGGQGPHKCKSCDYAVKTYGNLIRHEAVHQIERGNKPHKGRYSDVPASGTELFKQKNEALAAAQKSPPKQLQPTPLITDPEFGVLIHGSPEFIYPTYYKNGKLKEKRYKCHKCPSAFEKREQYKIHLSLHGSKQRYNCERCDYSVKYYANYSQHMKKHDQNDASQKEKKNCSSDRSEDAGEEMEVSENEQPLTTPIIFERSSKSLKLSVADQQAMMLMQQRNIAKPVNEKEIISRCPECPYANNRKDGVNSHIRCHSDAKGGQYTCKYCNYNVPQPHFLREHLKVHFNPLKYLKPEAYMKVDKLEIWAEPLDPNHNFNKFMVFKDQGENFNRKDRFLPKREIDFEGIKGRVYINLKTGEEEVELDDEEKDDQSDISKHENILNSSNEEEEEDDCEHESSELPFENGIKSGKDEEENNQDGDAHNVEITVNVGSNNLDMEKRKANHNLCNSDSEDSCDSSASYSSCSQLTNGTNNQD